MAPSNDSQPQLPTTGERDQLHTLLRSIAKLAQRIDAARGTDRQAVRALRQRIRLVHDTAQGSVGGEIGRWLENLQARIDPQQVLTGSC